MVENIFKEKINSRACENINQAKEVAIGIGMNFRYVINTFFIILLLNNSVISSIHTIQAVMKNTKTYNLVVLLSFIYVQNTNTKFVLRYKTQHSCSAFQFIVRVICYVFQKGIF